jgi:class 3 adenylate cyclase
LQRAIAELMPLSTDRRIDSRIGIKVGDVVVEDDDVFGDGGLPR